MKLNLRFLQFNDSPKHRNLVKRELEPLSKDIPIDIADTTVSMPSEGDGRIDAHVHLAIPGPDIRVTASDYTLEAVMKKLGRRIREAWKHRLSKRAAVTKHLRMIPSGAH